MLEYRICRGIRWENMFVIINPVDCCIYTFILGYVGVEGDNIACKKKAFIRDFFKFRTLERKWVESFR